MKLKAKKIFKISLLTYFLTIGYYSSFAQTVEVSTNSYIIAFNGIYASNFIEVASVNIGDLYLLKSNMPLKIDSVICALSKKKYASRSEIIDTFKQSFGLFAIVQDTSAIQAEKGKMPDKIMDLNYYKAAYLFSFNDTVKKYSPVQGYIIQRFTFGEKISYCILNNNCGKDFPAECTAVIKKVE
ncbi:hypothetical protein CLV51_103324 [Chitinophaga niastensis]|uniref:Uncharacterized protein n=1 Tax=Chitinophaga niastensis TaxID=536980 RepID=A0A2P8HJF1_CHINA|nr:hypothetical protein [Chitinophaga niastensis]PSL46346.1 hypothetical protein CLV51_103324 [Chitinophaga niastensis]